MGRIPRHGNQALRAAVGAVAMIGVTALSVFMGSAGRDSAGAHAVVLVTIVLVLVLAVPGRTGPELHVPQEHRSGVAGWLLLVAATVGWDLYCFASSSPNLPPLSRLIGHVSAHAVGRGLLFALWLALGVGAALGWRVAPRLWRKSQ